MPELNSIYVCIDDASASSVVATAELFVLESFELIVSSKVDDFEKTIS